MSNNGWTTQKAIQFDFEPGEQLENFLRSIRRGTRFRWDGTDQTLHGDHKPRSFRRLRKEVRENVGRIKRTVRRIQGWFYFLMNKLRP